jgi:SAM-dependent methyltransferase
MLLTSVLQHFGYKPKPRPFSEFIAFKETVKSARAAGLSVGDYIDRRHPVGGRSATAFTIDEMANFGVFDARLDRICEIGAGSGRYLEKTVGKAHPTLYEVYETSDEWRDWLIHHYDHHNVVARHCDGRTLGETDTASIALVQAHKLFPGLPFLIAVSYFQEMARVVRDGGWIVFDIMTEGCFSSDHLKEWFAENPWEWSWTPQFISKDFVRKFFADRGISFVGSFQVPLFPAVTECLVFRKI